jgi:hypothetical protein
MENMFAMDKNGNPGLVTFAGETHPELLWGVLLWQSFNLDDYGQYYAGSPYGGRNFWGVFDALSQARKKGGPVFKTMSTPWPMGTVVGIQTMWRIPSFVDSLRPLDAPVVPIMPVLYGGGIGKVNAQALKDYAPGFTVELYIFGVYYNRVKVTLTERSPGEWHAGYQILIEEFGAPACQYYIENQPKGASPYFIRLGVVLAEHEEQGGFETPLLYHLYHTKKINAEIYPPHNTALFPGTSVRILAEPRADRVLTEFTVQTVDRLAEATTEYADTTAKGITSPYGYDDTTKAKYTYGPVNSDVYVTAVAEGVEIEEEIQAGVEQTVQMTTTDCFVEEGSWSITGTSLPEDVEYSIDADGLITVFVPENVYDGNPGGRYYLDAQFEGYSQTKALRVWVTVASVTAYGTVWSAAGTLPDTPVAIFEASDKTVYITSETKVYTTTDFVTFSEVTLTGTRTGKFGNIAEAANGRLILLEANTSIGANARIWTKDPEDEGFTRRNDWAGFSNSWNTPTFVSAHPDSDVFLFGASTSYSAVNCLLTARNTNTGAVLHTVDVPRGTISGYAMPAVRLDDGTWLISVVGGGECKVYRYTEGVGFQIVLDDSTPSFGTLNLLYRESDDRVVLIGNESKTQWFSRYTTDGGTTWSDKTLLTVALNNQVLSAQPLKKNYLVAGAITSQIFHSTDTLATATAVAAALGGEISWIIKRRSGVLLAIARRSGGTNIWKSEA